MNVRSSNSSIRSRMVRQVVSPSFSPSRQSHSQTGSRCALGIRCSVIGMATSIIIFSDQFNSGRIMRDILVATVQMEHAAGDKPANFAKIERFIAQAAEQRVEMICFPECCITGYWFLRRQSKEQLEQLAERVPEGPS